jgi:AcrR family transcriptional regulator
MPPNSKRTSASPPRLRLARADRYRQLMDVAWRLVREEGSDALTLGRLAERAEVAKPVVYDHFATRQGLLAALFAEFSESQTLALESALATSEDTLDGRATVIASSYIDCVLAMGREIPGVIAALAGSPELEKIKQECDAAFMENCRSLIAPFAASGDIPAPALFALVGAAEALSSAAVTGAIEATQAREQLVDIIIAVVNRTPAAKKSRRR